MYLVGGIDMLENLGNKLKTARTNTKLSRKQVAELIGVSASTIGLYETGMRFPTLPNLVKLATHYKVSVDYLLDCNTSTKTSLPLDGLTEKQIQCLKSTADCFRNTSYL